ncbi:WhiB family transcriptional regulator [Streptomyces sp. NPDC013171]|uniref:WhiB family transcriptional regulator n=1 Tax=Streptomyces sp. NPDC013171 TaxID=3364863 RepID=UPI0036C871EC
MLQIEPAEPGAHWSASALCAQIGPTLFTPEQGRGGGPGRSDARTVCRRCPVRVECLDEALARDEPVGIWGGLNLRERRKLRRQAAAA